MPIYYMSQIFFRITVIYLYLIYSSLKFDTQIVFHNVQHMCYIPKINCLSSLGRWNYRDASSFMHIWESKDFETSYTFLWSFNHAINYFSASSSSLPSGSWNYGTVISCWGFILSYHHSVILYVKFIKIYWYVVPLKLFSYWTILNMKSIRKWMHLLKTFSGHCRIVVWWKIWNVYIWKVSHALQMTCTLSNMFYSMQEIYKWPQWKSSKEIGILL